MPRTYVPSICDECEDLVWVNDRTDGPWLRRRLCKSCKQGARLDILKSLGLWVGIPVAIFVVPFLIGKAMDGPPTPSPDPRPLTEEEQSWSDYLEDEEYNFTSPGDFGP